MGMAASQARFLGLTARKSNVEYQGQQVNQQRTALANESANLYNQMMTLDVPTPPATTDFYTTTYELEGSSDSYATENYTFQSESVKKTYNAENEYSIILTSKTETVSEVPYQYKTGSIGTKTVTKKTPATLVEDPRKVYNSNYYQRQVSGSSKEEENGTFNYIVTSKDSPLGQTDSSKVTYSVYDGGYVAATENNTVKYYRISDGIEVDEPADKGNLSENKTMIVSSKNSIPSSINTYDVPTKIITRNSNNYTISYDKNDLDAYSANGALTVNPFQIYKVDPDKKLTGKDECCGGTTGENYYFYQDSKGTNHFFTTEELQKLLNKESNETFNESYANTYNREVQHEVTGIMEKSSTGRFSSLKVYNDETIPEELRGITFNLNVKQVFDEDGYNDAMNDYKYQKDVYEQAINEINAKTEKIQKQDQNLELRLDQLDTEQNAIKTEMDAVTKVLKDNVEKTFKTFNA